ncbi:MAG: formylglycine-generating enzyme family protein [Thermoguttaceae bacterium]|nr:formylglycine-generating enzyme family protein [Thermoguttaceae bacterium]
MDEIPDENFVLIKANPTFTFERSLESPRTSIGKKSLISSAYCLAKYPVTNDDYLQFVKATGHRTPKYWKNGQYPQGKGRHPVLEVSFDDALAYCDWLKTKYLTWDFRLPTEAEWENAAAGPEHFEFPWGNTPEVNLNNEKSGTKFNFNGVVASCYMNRDPKRSVRFVHQKSTREGEQVPLDELISVDSSGRVKGWINHQDYTGFVYTDLFKSLSKEGGFTTPVDQYPQGKSPYGCYDMAGNSWEWTDSDIIATQGAEQGKTVKAIRGGSWYATMNSCRTNYRGEGRRPQGCYNTVGFRVAATPMKDTRE